MENQYKVYDGIIEVALTNLYTLGNKNAVVVFSGFDQKEEGHKCMTYIMQQAHSLFGIEFAFEIGFWKYLRFWLKNKTFRWIKRNKKKNPVTMSMDEFLLNIEAANNLPFIFNKIYKEYYKD